MLKLTNVVNVVKMVKNAIRSICATLVVKVDVVE